jgi:hypothetical protein
VEIFLVQDVMETTKKIRKEVNIDEITHEGCHVDCVDD